MKFVLLVFFIHCCHKVQSQLTANQLPAAKQIAISSLLPLDFSNDLSGRKLFQRNSGMILGLQRGKYTALELGAEAHWRKISLLNPHIIGATANLEYNIADHVLGYKAGVWMKRGRINLTYGINVSYFTDFNNHQLFGGGPAVGFRFFGFHLINGYNFFAFDNSKPELQAMPVNNLYMSLRYYFPVENKFTWDRKTIKKKKARQKERHRRQKQRKKEVKNGDRKPLRLPPFLQKNK